MRGQRYSGDAMMLVTALLMGSSYPFAKDVLAVMSPLLYSASRYLIAALFLFAVLAVRRRPMALPRRDWVPMILLSIVGVALFQACWGWAMARSAPSVGSIVMTTTTAFSAILAWFAGRRLSLLGWTGILIAFIGVVLVVNNSLSRVTLSFGSLDGTLLWLIAAFAWALYVERGAPYSQRLGALQVMAWTTLIGSLLLMPFALYFDSLGEFARLDDRLLGFWLYTAIFPVGVAFLGLTAGLERLGVSRVMVYMYLIPVAGVGLSAAFFGDPLTAARVIGGLVVLLGVILTRLALDRAARVPV
ncbi:MAG: DMT family transporter [Reyranella sp.]|uniref:DMT family transporter n=1 Tax=Reyranella sp. TaxID=1929291 RepID=UPI0025E793BE|nr:DMT family transporter [Reyranella sp.]MBR2819505.1 DMT family transporter [Reyranella sp.]